MPASHEYDHLKKDNFHELRDEMERPRKKTFKDEVDEEMERQSPKRDWMDNNE